MGNTKFFLRGLLVVGLVGALCTCGLAAEQSTQRNRGSAARSDANQPGAAQPGTARQQQMPSQMPEAGQKMMLHKTSELIGKTIKNTQGEDLGTIHDLVLSPDYQQVSYVALSYGGVFGVGGRLHAIPWQALNVGPKGDITVSISRDQLKQASGFDNDNWPSQADPQWSKAGAASQGQATAREPQAGQAQQPMGTTGRAAMAGRGVEMRRVTRLTGMEVKNPTNGNLGDIEDFVVSASDGRLVYTIISFGGIAGIGESYAAVPSNAVQIQPQNQVAVLNATQQTLQSIAYKSGEAPNLASNEYMQRARQLFPAAPSGTALGYVPPEPPQPADEESAWGPESRYSKSFSPGTTKTIRGTVESVGCFRPEGAKAGVPTGLRLRVRTADGNLMTVHAGPISYVEQQNFFLMPGDQISITGSEAKAGMRSVIVASEIRKGTQTLQLRDQSGRPLWSTGRQAPTRGQQETRPRTGQQRPGAAGQRQPGQSTDQPRQP